MKKINLQIKIHYYFLLFWGLHVQVFIADLRARVHHEEEQKQVESERRTQHVCNHPHPLRVRNHSQLTLNYDLTQHEIKDH